MASQLRLGDRLYNAAIYSLGALIAIGVIYPLYFVVIASVSEPQYVASGQVWLLPQGITTRGYEIIFGDARIWTGYKNTILYSSVGTAVALAVTLPAAFAMSRKELMLRNPFMVFFVITIFFNGGLIPTYLLVQRLGIVNTMWAIVLPAAFNVFHMIIARTFFQTTIPRDVADAATMDGCSTTRFFAQIVLPLSNAIVAVIALYAVVGHWNSYFSALVYLRDADRYPLQLVLRDILIRSITLDQSVVFGPTRDVMIGQVIKYGVIIVSTLPVLVLYPFLQKYFTKGVMIGALKG